MSWRNPEGDVHIRVYYQDTANKLSEQCNDHGAWTAGGVSLGTGTLSTGIAATQWTDDAGFHLRVYWFNAIILPSPVVAMSLYDNGQWRYGPTTDISSDGSGLAGSSGPTAPAAVPTA